MTTDGQSDLWIIPVQCESCTQERYFKMAQSCWLWWVVRRRDKEERQFTLLLACFTPLHCFCVILIIIVVCLLGGFRFLF